MELSLKPSHAKVKDYYNALNQFGQLNISHESAVRQAFASLLDTCARQFKWKLVQEFRLPAPKNKSVIVDGAVLDSFTLKHGFWEAKDSKDDLEKEIKKKLEQGYPRDNIIFQSPERAILYQNGARQGLDEDITNPENLVELLKRFFSYTKPELEEWKRAVEEFAPHIPDIAAKVKEILDKERKKNKDFVIAFAGFAELCRQAINPNLSDDAVETMLIQHLLTERIFRKVFNRPEFTSRNIIAIEIEKVIKTITDKRFSRDEFLKDLDYFYRAIEDNARNATDYSEKQSFLNTVYERFFQGFSPKEADTHGIVYTPQPIVNFMVRSVEEILKKEFGKSLGDREVHILDPFVGTGNFIVRVMQEIPKTRLPYKYENELHCNEVMLLPYYIASMNIEHAYLEATTEGYKPFEGICLVDTFELAEAKQMPMFTAKNTERVERQKQAPIFVIIGNPPYNVGQDEENDNNKNRTYPALDRRIADTYTKDSRATNKNTMRDPYIRAIRWASDRIGKEGVVALITNSKFVHGKAADGIRQHLQNDFDHLYIFDLGGDVRSNPKLSGTKNNVFGIQLGVSINLFVRKSARQRPGTISYTRVDEYWTREEKLRHLLEVSAANEVHWSTIHPNRQNTWVLADTDHEFASLVPLLSERNENGIFEINSNGVKTNRDPWAFNFDRELLGSQMKRTIAFYNDHVNRYLREKPKSVDDFVTYDDKKISWSRDLKKDLTRGKFAEFAPQKIQIALYRPFTKEFLYFDRVFNEEVYILQDVYPQGQANHALVVTAHSQIPFSTQFTDIIPCVDVGGRPSQLFPFFVFDQDGTNRRENITDWALGEFREVYGDYEITKWDIFYYTYAVLHHPEYRTRYAANLKRELPRIPYAPVSRMRPPSSPLSKRASAWLRCTWTTKNKKNIRWSAARSPAKSSTYAWKKCA